MGKAVGDKRIIFFSFIVSAYLSWKNRDDLSLLHSHSERRRPHES